MSHSVLISTFFRRANPRLSALPWPRVPMLAVTTRSLAPSTRAAGASAHNAPAAAVCSRNSLRRISGLQSERQSKPKPHRPLIGRSAVAVQHIRDLAEVGRVEIAAGPVEVRRIEQVEHVGAELALELVRKRDDLRQDGIDVD